MKEESYVSDTYVVIPGMEQELPSLLMTAQLESLVSLSSPISFPLGSWNQGSRKGCLASVPSHCRFSSLLLFILVPASSDQASRRDA